MRFLEGSFNVKIESFIFYIKRGKMLRQKRIISFLIVLLNHFFLKLLDGCRDFDNLQI